MGANEMQISLFNYNYMASRENFEGFLFWRKILERNRGAIVTDRGSIAEAALQVNGVFESA